MPIADRRAPPGNRRTLEARPALAGIVAFSALAGCAGRPPLPGPVFPLASSDEDPFRSRPPTPAIGGADVDPAPAVEEAILANGLKVWVVHRPRLPAIVLSLSVRLSPDQQRMISPELVRLTTRAVVEADTVWSDGKVVKPPTINGAWISYQTAPEGVTFSERILKSTLASGLEIIARTVRFPAFSEGGFADAQLEEMKATQDRSSSIDNQLLDIGLEAELGPEEANQRRPIRPKEVRRANRSDVVRCHEQLFRPDAALLVAVGDVTLPEVLAQATARFGDWTTRPSSPPIRADRREAQGGSRPDGRRVHLLAQSAGAQNPVLVLQSAPPRVQIEDEIPFDLVAEIAAGSGSLRSRANAILRHDLGATYGVHSSIFEMAGRGVLALGGSFDATALEDAILGLLRVLDDLRARGVSPEELVPAKNRLAAAFDRRLSTNAGQAGVLSELFLQGKDLRCMSSYPDRLRRASVADLQRVALRYLDPNNVDIVVAGPPSVQRTLGRVGAVHLYQLTKTSQ